MVMLRFNNSIEVMEVFVTDSISEILREVSISCVQTLCTLLHMLLLRSPSLNLFILNRVDVISW